MKKSEQIKALQAECDRLAAERDAYRQSLSLAHKEVRDCRALIAKRDQSLTDRVRSEFAERWGWLGDLVGL